MKMNSSLAHHSPKYLNFPKGINRMCMLYIANLHIVHVQIHIMFPDFRPEQPVLPIMTQGFNVLMYHLLCNNQYETHVLPDMH